MAQPKEPSAFKGLAELSSIGMTLVLATVIGVAAGYYADQWLGTGPWLLLLGLAFGIAAGFVSMYRSVKAAERRMHDQ
ncbi:MAG: AtpZ/AtpI family protein [Candidatus Rokuibacteriota bacterium]